MDEIRPLLARSLRLRRCRTQLRRNDESFERSTFTFFPYFVSFACVFVADSLICAGTDSALSAQLSKSYEHRWSKRYYSLFPLFFIPTDKFPPGAGLLPDIGVTDSSAYNTTLALYFLGYVLFEIPSNLVLKRGNPAIVLPTLAVTWGTVSICQGFIVSKQTLYIARFCSSSPAFQNRND